MIDKHDDAIKLALLENDVKEIKAILKEMVIPKIESIQDAKQEHKEELLNLKHENTINRWIAGIALAVSLGKVGFEVVSKFF